MFKQLNILAVLFFIIFPMQTVVYGTDRPKYEFVSHQYEFVSLAKVEYGEPWNQLMHYLDHEKKEIYKPGFLFEASYPEIIERWIEDWFRNLDTKSEHYPLYEKFVNKTRILAEEFQSQHWLKEVGVDDMRRMFIDQLYKLANDIAAELIDFIKEPNQVEPTISIKIVKENTPKKKKRSVNNSRYINSGINYEKIGLNFLIEQNLTGNKVGIGLAEWESDNNGVAEFDIASRATKNIMMLRPLPRNPTKKNKKNTINKLASTIKDWEPNTHIIVLDTLLPDIDNTIQKALKEFAAKGGIIIVNLQHQNDSEILEGYLQDETALNANAFLIVKGTNPEGTTLNNNYEISRKHTDRLVVAPEKMGELSAALIIAQGIALLCEKFPTLNTKDIANVILDTTRQLKGYKLVVQGKGLINFKNAYETLESEYISSVMFSPENIINILEFNKNATSELNTAYNEWQVTGQHEQRKNQEYKGRNFAKFEALIINDKGNILSVKNDGLLYITGWEANESGKSKLNDSANLDKIISLKSILRPKDLSIYMTGLNISKVKLQQSHSEVNILVNVHKNIVSLVESYPKDMDGYFIINIASYRGMCMECQNRSRKLAKMIEATLQEHGYTRLKVKIICSGIKPYDNVPLVAFHRKTFIREMINPDPYVFEYPTDVSSSNVLD